MARRDLSRPGAREMGVLVLLLSACATESYRDAIGYRARQAALARDLPAFAALMREAVAIEPETKTLDPPRTVLVHFFELADDPRFLPLAEAWMRLGWVSPDLRCALHRARWRGAIDRDPGRARRSLDVVLARARAAAQDPERGWELEACLGDTALLGAAPPDERRRLAGEVGDPARPLLYRRALLEGLAHVELTGTAARMAADPALSAAAARAAALAEARREADRLDALIRRVQTGTVSLPLLSAGTALAASRLERALVPLGESYFGRHAPGPLAWAWVRSMKAKDVIRDLEALGFWQDDIEGEADRFWFVCPADAEPEARAGGAVRVVPVRTVRQDAAEPRPAGCPLGPFPLEASARGAAAGRFTEGSDARVVIRVLERELR